MSSVVDSIIETRDKVQKEINERLSIIDTLNRVIDELSLGSETQEVIPYDSAIDRSYSSLSQARRAGERWGRIVRRALPSENPMSGPWIVQPKR